MNDNKIQIIKDDEIDLKALFQVLWNDRKRIIQITAFVTFIGVIYALLATPLYKSTITMYPSGQESGGQLSQIQGMASTFGFDMGGGDPSFHIPDIVRSRRIKNKLIYHEWETKEFDRPVNLIQYWGIDDTTSISLNPIHWIKSLFFDDELNLALEWEELAFEKISERIEVSEDKKTNLIKVNVWFEEPRLASKIANYVYSVIVEFTVETHVKKTMLNREFIEGRQAEVKEKLTELEEVLKVFRERNRSIMESPQLQLEIERLMREVEIKTQVYLTLQKQYELARIEEVKETPSVVILDKGNIPVLKDKPRRKLIVIAVFILSITITSLYMIFINSFRRID